MAAHEAAAMRAAAAALLAVAALASGCSAGSGDSGVDPNDKRGVALECITKDKGLDARAEGTNKIQVGDAKTGPEITFFVTGGQAEAEQFEGRGEGAEQIKNALLFVREGSEDDLGKIEECLNDL
jgi:hypothetical protein